MSDDFDLVAHAKRCARDALNSLEGPDEDILPVVLSHGPRGLDVLGAFMPESDDGKDGLAEMMTAKIAVAQAKEAAMVCTAYLRPVDPDTGKIVGKQEVIVLVVCHEDGQQQAWTANITRHPNRPPDMSIWEEMAVGEAIIGGRFAEAMLTGLAFARTVDPDMQEILDDGYRNNRVDELVQMFLAAKSALELARGLET